MVNFKELVSRIRTDLRFSWQEISSLIAAILVFGFIFSFRDWGTEEFSLVIGLQNFVLAAFIASIAFFFRAFCQKTYGLIEGHKAEFKIWWAGLLISLIVAFLTKGIVPLVLLGSMVPVFMVRQRLGEFRYGFNYWVNGIISYWGVIGSLILAILFGLGSYLMPESYFFSKGLQFNLIMALCSLLPFPQLDGLNIFFGARWLYYLGIVLVLLAAVLLLTKTLFGILFAIVAGVVYGGIVLLIGSEK